MSLAALVLGRGPSGFGYGSTAEEVSAGIDLSGKTYLVTGCNSGLGLETVRVLAKRGAAIIALARSKESAQATLAKVSARGTAVACDLSEPSSVRAAAAAVRAEAPLAGIICNAGIMALPKREVKHGLELQFLTNHVGHFLLVTELMERLDDGARVVVLSSSAHWSAPRGGIRFDDLGASRSYSGWMAYSQSKLANILFARTLAKRLAGRRTANSVHPGMIKTNLGRHMGTPIKIGYALGGPLVLKTVEQGAATQCYVAVHPSAAGITGKYFADCNVARPSRLAEDDALAERLWTKSEELARSL